MKGDATLFHQNRSKQQRKSHSHDLPCLEQALSSGPITRGNSVERQIFQIKDIKRNLLPLKFFPSFFATQFLHAVILCILYIFYCLQLLPRVFIKTTNYKNFKISCKNALLMFVHITHVQHKAIVFCHPLKMLGLRSQTMHNE